MIEVHPNVLLPDPDATTRLAQRLSQVVGVGDVLLLDGQIGAGKTHLARALIQTLVGGDEDVPSPTFTLVQVYDAPGHEIWHSDLYRLTHPDEAVELGLTEAFETALCLVEWPARLNAQDIPISSLTLRFHVESQGRSVSFHSHSPAWQQRLKGICDV